MRRRIFSITSLLSLLLCVATVVLWVRSYRVYDWTGYACDFRDGKWTRIRFASGAGGILFDFQRTRLNPGSAAVPGFFYDTEEPFPSGIFAPRPEPPTFWYRHNFAAVNTHWSWWTFVGILLPDWLIVGVLAVCPAAWWLRFRLRLARRMHSQCAACSYNLTGNTSGTCPECGTPIPQTTRPA